MLLSVNYDYVVFVRLFVSFVVGILIGLDRERSGKAAGIRTQMLVCVGSTLFSLISIYLGRSYGFTNIDPTRLMAQIVSGIGFLGAGVIIKEGAKVQGVTTAATIWITAAVGVAIGSGFYTPALLTTIFILTLNPIAHLQYKYGLKGDFFIIKVPIKYEEKLEKILQHQLTDVRQRSVVNGEVKAMVHSSQQNNKELILIFRKQKIPFEITISED